MAVSKTGVALVIGSATGIGKGVALRFKEEGAKLVLADVEEKAGRATAEELGAEFIRTDISKMDDAQAAVALAQDDIRPARYHRAERRDLSAGS